MTKRESDTSASEAETDAEAQAPNPDGLFDALVEADVLAVGDDGGVRTTDAFDDTHAVYHDSYVGVADAEFHEAVAVTFGLPDAEAAAELVAARGVAHEEFVCYLAVQSHLDGEVRQADLAAMAGMVHEVVPDSPVPPEVADVTDDPRAFVAGRDRAVVSVWKRFCDPCEALKADLGGILDALPDDVKVAGIDGEIATNFCETHGVESAPGFVLLRDGDSRTILDSDSVTVARKLRAFFGD